MGGRAGGRAQVRVRRALSPCCEKTCVQQRCLIQVPTCVHGLRANAPCRAAPAHEVCAISRACTAAAAFAAGPSPIAAPALSATGSTGDAVPLDASRGGAAWPSAPAGADAPASSAAPSRGEAAAPPGAAPPSAAPGGGSVRSRSWRNRWCRSSCSRRSRRSDCSTRDRFSSLAFWFCSVSSVLLVRSRCATPNQTTGGDRRVSARQTAVRVLPSPKAAPRPTGPGCPCS